MFRYWTRCPDTDYIGYRARYPNVKPVCSDIGTGVEILAQVSKTLDQVSRYWSSPDIELGVCILGKVSRILHQVSGYWLMCPYTSLGI